MLHHISHLCPCLLPHTHTRTSVPKNVTNATWSDYDVLYINPVADFGPGDALDSWAATVRAIKIGNPTAVVLGTFHTTEVNTTSHTAAMLAQQRTETIIFCPHSHQFHLPMHAHCALTHNYTLAFTLAHTHTLMQQSDRTAPPLANTRHSQVWYKDMIRPGSGQSWLPVTCIMRNANGTPCDWWVPFPDGIITTNMFRDECLASVTNYALAALPELVDAGMDGVFLDGLIPYADPTAPHSHSLSDRWSDGLTYNVTY